MKKQSKIIVLLPSENSIQPRSCSGGVGSFGGTAIK